jgi:polyhydroxyalkanoate synthase
MDIEDIPYGFGLAGIDPSSLARALATATLDVARRPKTFLRVLAELAAAEGAVAVDVVRHALDSGEPPIAAPDARDKRFTDRAWTENPLLRATMESYVVSSRIASRLVDASEVDGDTRRKARFALTVALDALSPTNVPWLNPAAVKELFETGGLSALRGARHFGQDLRHNQGRPRHFEPDTYRLGDTLAATPGRVVYRNDLIELIAYEPQTESVYSEPIVYQPAWINKYYVLDLTPGRSFIEYAVRGGFTVFAISYRNPDASMKHLLLDDYLRDGLLTAVDQVEQLTGSTRVNLVSVCLGGTLTMMALGSLAARGDAERIGWATLNVALVDFSEPGDVGAFTDEASIEHIERRNARRGYLSSGDMQAPFNLMRTNELFWSYVISNWYMGRKPVPFDILAWNADPARLPAAMHSQFLRSCYLENQLATPGAFKIDGTTVDLRDVETPLYVLGGETDHIAPWQSVYRTTQLVGGPVRFVLTSGGHIAGMVNPPGKPNARHYVNDQIPDDPKVWQAGAQQVAGSWWEDWLAWASVRSGDRVAPPLLPAGDAAPGQYVVS